MDKEILEQYSSAKAEIADNKRRIQSSRDKISRMEEKGYKEIDTVKGGSGGIQHFMIEGFPYPGYSRQKSLLYARLARLNRLQEDLIELTDQVEQYINEIGTSRIRRILTMRYIDELSWRDVAKRMGPGNTEDACRKELKKFLSEN